MKAAGIRLVVLVGSTRLAVSIHEKVYSSTHDGSIWTVRKEPVARVMKGKSEVMLKRGGGQRVGLVVEGEDEVGEIEGA